MSGIGTLVRANTGKTLVAAGVIAAGGALFAAREVTRDDGGIEIKRGTGDRVADFSATVAGIEERSNGHLSRSQAIDMAALIEQNAGRRGVYLSESTGQAAGAVFELYRSSWAYGGDDNVALNKTNDLIGAKPSRQWYGSAKDDIEFYDGIRSQTGDHLTREQTMEYAASVEELAWDGPFSRGRNSLGRSSMVVNKELGERAGRIVEGMHQAGKSYEDAIDAAREIINDEESDHWDSSVETFADLTHAIAEELGIAVSDPVVQILAEDIVRKYDANSWRDPDPILGTTAARAYKEFLETTGDASDALARTRELVSSDYGDTN